MIVGDIFTDIQDVLGTCDEAKTFNKINEAIEELANLANWDPMVVYMDICTTGCEITLPEDIEVPLAINVGGHPADFRNKWFEFHLNGPGSECCGQSCNFSWSDKGTFPVFRDPIRPSQIAAYPETDEALGANIRVYGYDKNNKWIMTPDCHGVLQDGFDVPIIFGFGSGVPSTEIVKRIVRIAKPVTNGFVKLTAIDSGTESGQTLLGVFRPNVTEPSYRRITVNGGGTTLLTSSNPAPHCSCMTWVRMRARRKIFKVSQLSDFIPLHSVTALKQMCQAIKKYEADLIDEYGKYFASAKASLEREQKSRSGPNQIKIQFQGAYAGKPCSNMI